MIRFRTKTEGFRETRRALQDVREYIREPMRFSYGNLARLLSREIKEAFRGRYNPQQGRRRWRRKVDGTPARLIRTGRMFRAVTRQQVWQRRGDKKIVFNPSRSVFYWRFHQFGTRNLPVRGFLPARRRVTELVTQEMEHQVEVRWNARR